MEDRGRLEDGTMLGDVDGHEGFRLERTENVSIILNFRYVSDVLLGIEILSWVDPSFSNATIDNNM